MRPRPSASYAATRAEGSVTMGWKSIVTAPWSMQLADLRGSARRSGGSGAPCGRACRSSSARPPPARRAPPGTRSPRRAGRRPRAGGPPRPARGSGTCRCGCRGRGRAATARRSRSPRGSSRRGPTGRTSWSSAGRPTRKGRGWTGVRCSDAVVVEPALEDPEARRPRPRRGPRAAGRAARRSPAR